MLLFYLLFYAAGRLVIENLRMDSLYLGSSVRISQLLSVLLCAAVMTIFLQRKRKRQGGLTNLQKTLMIPVYLYGFLTVLFCLRVILPAVQPLQEAVLLTAFSVIYASVSRILYGSSSHSEVLYADHKAA